MGRDVGRDEGRDQAAWRDLVARLEISVPIDPDHAPWPDRENLKTRSPQAGSGQAQPPDQAATADPAAALPGIASPGDLKPADADSEPGNSDGERKADRRTPANGGRVIRPAGFPCLYQPVTEPPAPDDEALTTERELAGPPLGPRDYHVAEPRDDDLDDGDNRYIPPPVPPQPRLDPVAKGAWLALFGGPGYLLIATLLSWQIAGWAALACVAAFISGFVVLVVKLGDGPSKRDGPDQGAVV
ncbi:MAG TPA: hypothetical protein VFQ44_19505 [Streptosporangiaceae bacterium]|nr:hypothetical protein [Streptosporangiaceae bacterium]